MLELEYTLRAVLWAFSPVLVLGGAWLVVSLGAKVIGKLFDYPKYW